MLWLLLSLFIFLIGYKRLHFQGDGELPYQADLSWKNFFPMLIAVVIAIPIIRELLNFALVSNVLLLVLGAGMLLVIVYLAMKEHGEARTKLLTLLIFVVIGMTFWALYMLAPSALMIFVQHNVNRNVFGFTIPTSSIYGLNPFFIITLGPLMSLFFLWLARRNKVFSLPGKFSCGIILMGLGYLALLLGIVLISQNGLVALGFVVLSYFLQSLGELFIGPVGYSMIGSLSPAHLEGLMMGVFRLSIGVAGAASGFLAAATAAPKDVFTPSVTNPIFAHSFGLYGVVTVIVGLIVMLLIPQFKKLF